MAGLLFVALLAEMMLLSVGDATAAATGPGTGARTVGVGTFGASVGSNLTARHAWGDFTGDGKADLSVWRPPTSTWYVHGTNPLQWGRSGDIPVPADYTGDGKAEIAVWRPATGTWYIHILHASAEVRWGVQGDIPVAADFTGDGKTDLAVWRPSNGTWYIHGITTRDSGGDPHRNQTARR